MRIGGFLPSSRFDQKGVAEAACSSAACRKTNARSAQNSRMEATRNSPPATCGQRMTGLEARSTLRVREIGEIFANLPGRAIQTTLD